MSMIFNTVLCPNCNKSMPASTNPYYLCPNCANRVCGNCRWFTPGLPITCTLLERFTTKSGSCNGFQRKNYNEIS